MTTPGQSPSPEDGAFVIGGGEWQYGQNLTEEVARALWEVPHFLATNAFEVLEYLLLQLPLEALQRFREFIPDVVEDAFDTVSGAVAAILGALSPQAIAMRISEFQEFLQTLWNDPGQFLHDLPQNIVDGLQTALDTIQNWIQTVVDMLLGALGITPEGDLLDRMFDLSDEIEWLQETATGAWNGVEDLVQRLMGMFGSDPQEGGLLDWIETAADGLSGHLDNAQNAFENLLSSLWGGFRRASGSGGIGVGDVGNAASDTSEQADTARQIGEWNTAVLGLRNNKSLAQGVDETEESNFYYMDMWGLGSEPAAAYAASSSSFPVAYWRAGETAKKGFISWFGKGFTDVSALHIDIYRANYDEQKWELIHSSPNLISMVDNTWRYHIYNIANVEDRVDVVSGDVLGVAWRVVGSGTHSIAGIPIAGMPDHPNLHPKKPVSVRSGVGDLAFASTSYTANTLPWVGIGIIEGDIPPPYYAPRTTPFVTPGTHVFTIPQEFRVAGNIIDVVAIGGGRGGGGALTWAPGTGGGAADWVGRSLVYGTDITSPGLVIKVGEGGDGGLGTVGEPGEDGEESRVTGSGFSAIVAEGADHTVGVANVQAEGAGNFNFAGRHYIGGHGGGMNQTGGNPGGGGGGGFPWTSGKRAGHGAVYITTRQP